MSVKGPAGRIALTPFSHDDYTVGWVCALPLEMAAAKAMLDEIHPSLPNSFDDHNTYTLGQIGAHNIVIACMPSGVYGTTSAVTVAASMRSSFRSILVGLMVGIGGGAPSQHAEIRLGDVVVSKPNENFGGVVQFDYGKTIQDGIFKRIGTLNKPPYVLLTAVSQLQADHRMRPSRIPEYLSKMAAKYPSMVPDFAYCGRRPDHLFEAQYEHNDLEDTCEHCDPGRLVTRPPRPGNAPMIHYGLVASGNRVMKHGETRDRLARELGILCFEMEAAGLMDHFPYLVIRGICDYTNSHKNKQWQEYTAATAAAYAKEILSVVPEIQITKSPTIATSTMIQLSVAGGTAINPYQDELDARCHPNTRAELLKNIYKASRLKSTTSRTIRTMTVTSQVLNDYNQLIERTVSNLKEHLQKVDESLQQLSSQRSQASDEENTKQQLMQEEMETTQQYLKICAEGSAHINKFQLTNLQVDSSLLDSLSASQPTTNGLQHDKLSDTITKLEDLDLTEKETKLPYITYTVGEPISLASGVPSLASFAIQSTKRLCGVIEGLRNKPSIVRELNEELEALLSALQSLQDIRTNPQLDLSVFSLPLLRSGQACQAFAEIIEKCIAHSSKEKKSFRDWNILTYQGKDIGIFRSIIAGYKSTFVIALADANI